MSFKYHLRLPVQATVEGNGGLLGAITGALVLCAMFACADDANDDSDGGLTIDEAAELVCRREANAFGWCVAPRCLLLLFAACSCARACLAE